LIKWEWRWRQVKNNHRESPYDIGYGKPPHRTRFQKGQSGNSRGRPRAANNFATIVGEALREPVVINENGRRKRATKAEVIGKQLVNKAAKGDSKLILLLVSFLEKHPQTNTYSTTMTAAELDEKMNLIASAVGILADLGVPIPVVTDTGKAAVSRSTDPKTGPKSG
jgi:hypothetical protein